MNRKRNIDKIEIFIVVLVMLSVVVAISGMSFARYTTSGKGTPSHARVAKWGIVIDVDASNMFAATADGPMDAILTPGADGLSVVSADVSVLPNTEGALNFRISGTAEVVARISFMIPDDLEIVCLKNAEGEIVYSPILWSLTKNEEEVLTKGDLAALKATLAESIVEANEELDDSYTLKWEWPFERGADEQEKAVNNQYDTMLAKYKADPQENPLPEGYSAVLDFCFNMTIDVSQIQNFETTE